MIGISKEREAALRAAYAAKTPIAVIARQLKSTPSSVKVQASKLGLTTKGRETWDFRRGFAVPESKQADYANLLRKGFRAREAAAILGIALEGEGKRRA